MAKVKKAGLSQSQIIEVGLLFIAEHDVESLSFRRLAAELNVSAMALYRHFENKQELLIALLDEFIQRADVLPKEALPWQQWLEYVLRRMADALLSQPSWLPLLGAMPLQHGAFQVLDQSLNTLSQSLLQAL